MIIQFNTLTPEHQWRNTPMHLLKAEHKLITSKDGWKQFGSWKIGNKTYNQVERFWSQYYEFRFNTCDITQSAT